MGTRNLTVIVHNQEVKVAQYGQWDGYPDGQGLTLLAFLSSPPFTEDLKKIVLPKVRFQNEKDKKDKEMFLQSIGSKDGWMNMEQVEKYKKKYPLHHRDVGGEILFKLLESRFDEEIVLVNSYNFASDSLFCEWAYVIDYDTNTFEVYKGFNTAGISEEDRFFPLYDGENDYYPVKIIASFPLDDLPDENEFLLQCSM